MIYKNGFINIIVNITITFFFNIIFSTNVFSSNPADGYVYSVQHYLINFVSDLRLVCGFLWLLCGSFTNKTVLHDITEIVLKVALNIIALTITSTPSNRLRV